MPGSLLHGEGTHHMYRDGGPAQRGPKGGALNRTMGAPRAQEIFWLPPSLSGVPDVPIKMVPSGLITRLLGDFSGIPRTPSGLPAPELCLDFELADPG